MNAWTTALHITALTGALAGAQAQTLPPLTQANGALHPGWRYVGFPKQKAQIPPTLIEAGQVEGQAGVKVVTASSYGTLVHDLKDAPPARLQWRWRLDQPLSGGQAKPDLTTKAGDDAALKVCAMFDHPLERVPFVERTVLRIARSVSGEALPAATVCYVWDTGHAAGLQGANPYSRRVRYISLRGDETPTGQWVTESRDLAQDFITLFGDELPQGAQSPRGELPMVATVLIGADSDNTASRSSGWVADLRWTASGP
ncbi:DUF3047 domain-containing protein [Hydrogenophaga pseudoflava]|uniref:DUF3047 domain-containing protein n=1 Tax=Hydrogenophaga pseudoflava TaxID=47421 RepID=UPI0027E48029|nr:DUF3047 domain-containing protein [Hydrogenophaga pseudoflava]MDQ7746729.1 DUF3047 domain-containing protein [Hydrogenophaga pseudoflava]